MPEITRVILLDDWRAPLLESVIVDDQVSTMGDQIDDAASQLTATAERFGLGRPDDIAIVEEIACRGCGCTEDHACMTARGPCHWVEPDLCSACAGRKVLLP